MVKVFALMVLALALMGESKPPSDGVQHFQQAKSPDQSVINVSESPQSNPDHTSPDWWQVGLTFGLLVVGSVQTYVFWFQAQKLKQTVRLGREEFITTHRPRIRVRNIVVDPLTSSTTLAPFNPDQFVSGQFYVSNVGESDAAICAIHSEVIWTANPLPMRRPYEGKNPNFPVKLKIVAGGSVPVTFKSDSVMDNPSSMHIHNGSMRIYVMGWIEYQSMGQRNVLRTAFCREYDPHKQRFYLVEDRDYEHEE